MKSNIGIFDGNLRIAFGVAFMVVVGLYGSPWAFLGLAITLTGFTRWCPLYAPFGLDTCESS